MRGAFRRDSSWCHRNVHHLLHGNGPSLPTPCTFQSTGKDAPQCTSCRSSRQGIRNPTLILKAQGFQDMSGSLFLFSPVHQIHLAFFFFLNDSRSFLESMCLPFLCRPLLSYLNFSSGPFVVSWPSKTSAWHVRCKILFWKAFCMYTKRLPHCLSHFLASCKFKYGTKWKMTSK